MAKKPLKEAKQKIPGILPVPAPVIDHHGPHLFGPMQEWSAQGRVPPVLLMTGTAGSGKRQLAYWLAQWILCQKSVFSKIASTTAVVSAEGGESDMFSGGLFGEPPAPAQEEVTPSHAHQQPCGECSSCHRAIQGNWVDFTEILAEDADGETSGSGTLKVDQFRKIKASLGFGAHEGPYRIILIPNADRMTPQAANSVLKLLEEPPPGWVFFLTASDPTLVLPTILSRCQSLRLRPFSSATIRELLSLEEIDPQRAAVCAELAQGSWSKALSLAGDEGWGHRQTLFCFLKNPAEKINTLVDWASSAPNQFPLLVDQLEQLTSDLIRWSVSREVQRPESFPWSNSDGKTALIAHATAVSRRHGNVDRARDFWLDRAERLAEVRQESLAPLNRKILIQDLLLPWVNAV
ncbi:hypothetical protein WDW37_03095 [Bdellovibrionota bacterium FG-1]